MVELTSGIFCDEQIGELFSLQHLTSRKPLDPDQIQPASLDLRLGEKAYRVRASFLPGEKCTVREKLAQYQLHEFDLRAGAVLETGCVYVVPLLEELALPADTSASANPKSSTGRLDIFTRLIADHSRQFDVIPAAFNGEIYLEISPRTFPVIVRTGSRLAQIRFRKGEPALDVAALSALHAQQKLVDTVEADITTRGIALSVDLLGNSDGLIGYRGKRHSNVVDVDRKAAHPVGEFWEPIHRSATGELVLDPDQFYILVSREAVQVPPAYAAEMAPFDPLVGEFRVHYAGFFDPGFGCGEAGGQGSRAVLEVRSHEVPFILEHGQTVGRLVYERMLARPASLYGDDRGSHYQAQGLKLSKHFF